MSARPADVSPALVPFLVSRLTELISHSECYHCIRGTSLYCEKFEIHGVSMHGGFAEYASFHHAKLFKIENLTDLEATLLEPASCAVHGLDKLQLKRRQIST